MARPASLTFSVTGAGLVATPSPGSIFAYMAVTPRGGHFGVLLGIAISAGVTFAVAALLLGFGRLEKDQESRADADAIAAGPGAARRQPNGRVQARAASGA